MLQVNILFLLSAVHRRAQLTHQRSAGDQARLDGPVRLLLSGNNESAFLILLCRLVSILKSIGAKKIFLNPCSSIEQIRDVQMSVCLFCLFQLDFLVCLFIVFSFRPQFLKLSLFVLNLSDLDSRRHFVRPLLPSSEIHQPD